MATWGRKDGTHHTGIKPCAARSGWFEFHLFTAIKKTPRSDDSLAEIRRPLFHYQSDLLHGSFNISLKRGLFSYYLKVARIEMLSRDNGDPGCCFNTDVCFTQLGKCPCCREPIPKVVMKLVDVIHQLEAEHRQPWRVILFNSVNWTKMLVTLRKFYSCGRLPTANSDGLFEKSFHSLYDSERLYVDEDHVEGSTSSDGMFATLLR